MGGREGEESTKDGENESGGEIVKERESED